MINERAIKVCPWICDNLKYCLASIVNCMFNSLVCLLFCSDDKITKQNLDVTEPNVIVCPLQILYAGILDYFKCICTRFTNSS